MADLPDTILGLECKLFIGTAGIGQPDIEVTLARSVELALTSSTADTTVRGSGWRLTRRALKEASISVELVYRPSDPTYKMLFKSYDNGTAIGLFASDGYGSGLLCDAMATEFSQPQPLEDIVVVNVTLVPTLTSRYPEWIDGTDI